MVQKIYYPDGFSYISLENTSVEEETITFRVNSYDDLWILHQIVNAYNSLKVKLNVIIPCLPDAQADRRFEINQSSGLKLVLDFLAKLSVESLSIFHPHNPEVVEALLPKTCILPPYRYDIKSDVVILSPDAGAYKWVSKVYSDHEGYILSASKSRSWQDGKSILTQQLPKFDFREKKVAVVDDLMVGGGTFLGLGKLLLEEGASEIELYVSHITVQKLNKEVFNLFKKVTCTNSKYSEYFAPYGSRFAQPSNLDIKKIFSITEIKTN